MGNYTRGIIVEGESINEVTAMAYTNLLRYGVKIPSRNGDCSALYEFSYYLNNPLKRHLYLEGRTSNIFQLVGETLWVLAGSGDVKGYLETLMPRAPDYSDDGKTWRAAYGPRLYRYNQLRDVVSFFERDGKMTRRASVSIFMPEEDTFTQLEKNHGWSDSKDFCCNQLIHFYVMPDDTFNMRVTNRSNDAVFGMGINLTEFSVIQEVVFEHVRRLHPEIKMGHLSIYSNNFHAYDSTRQQVEDVVKAYWDPLKPITPDYQTRPLFVTQGPDIEWLQEICADFLKHCMESDRPQDVYQFCALRRVPDGTFFDYLQMTGFYFAQKRGLLESDDELVINCFQEDLKQALINSKFRKFDLTELLIHHPI